MFGLGKKEDDVVLVTTDEFLEQLVRQLEGKPFVAVNVSRALTHDPETNGGYMTVAAVALESEYLKVIPQLMGELTGNRKINLRATEEMLEILTKRGVPDVSPIGSEVTPEVVDQPESQAVEF